MESELLLKAIEEEIDRLRRVRNLLAGKSADASWEPAAGGRVVKKHSLSPEGRERIADAQRKRWAAHRRGMLEAQSGSSSANLL